MEIHARDVEAVDVRGDDGEQEEEAVHQAVVARASDYADCEWWEDDVDACYCDAVGEVAEGPHRARGL